MTITLGGSGSANQLRADLASTASTALGDALVGVKSALTGAGPRTQHQKNADSIAVTDFYANGVSGALVDPTGVVDSTLGIQAGINALKTIGGQINFPQGTYLVNLDSISVKGSFGNYGLKLIGDRAVLKSTSLGAPILDIDSTDGVTTAPSYFMNLTVDGIDILGPGTGVSGAGCVRITHAADVYLKNGTYKNAPYGISGVGCLTSTFDNLTLYGNTTGADMREDGGFAPNALTWKDCKFFFNLTSTYYSQNFNNGIQTFIGCNFESNNQAGNNADGAKAINFNTGAGEVNFIGCHFETNKGTDGVYYNGFDTTKTINLIGCQVIHTTANVVNIAQGQCLVSGGRIYNISATNQLYLSSANGYASINGCNTIVAGTIANATWIDKGTFKQGAASAGAGTGAFNTYLPTGNCARYDQGDTIRHDFYNTASTRITYFRSGDGLDFVFDQVQNKGWEFDCNNAGALYIARGGTGNKCIEPGADGTAGGWTCGSPSIRWSVVYAQTGTINTSDARMKQQIRSLSDAEKAASVRIKGQLRAFKFNDAVVEKGDGARIHFGVVAQDVKAAFEAEGLVAEDYALLCYDQWEDQFDSNQKLIAAAGDRYGVRYEELLAFVLGAM